MRHWKLILQGKHNQNDLHEDKQKRQYSSCKVTKVGESSYPAPAAAPSNTSHLHLPLI